MKHVLAVLAFTIVIGIAAYPAFLTVLVRAGAGQRVQTYNPRTHRVKAGTPTMGGVLFCLLVVLTWLVFDRTRAGFVIVFAMAGAAAIGLLDDVANIRGEGSLGLRVVQKLVLQSILGILIGVGVYLLHEQAQYFPLIGYVDLGWGVVPLSALAVVAATNAVNLTDGVDGLAASCGVVALLGTLAVAFQLHDARAATLAAALIGGLLAFLFYNWHPARVFMGDTGSLALGAALTALSIELHLLWVLPLLGLVFVAEAASVIINVTAITRFKRRIFRASPIHHHFEEIGLREQSLVLAFAGTGVVAMLLTLLFVRGMAVIH